MGGGVRITGGERKGRTLKVGPGVRPTEGRVRESLFSIWQGRVPEARFLDLFAVRDLARVGLQQLLQRVRLDRRAALEMEPAVARVVAVLQVGLDAES